MKNTIITTLILLSALIFASFSLREKDKDKDAQSQEIVDSKRLDANTISAWFRNNGSFNRDPATGDSGFEWPKGSNKFARYASGMWLGARVGNDTLVTVTYYDYEFLPGYTDNSGNPQGKDDLLYKVYKLTYGINDPDRQQWPNVLLGNSDQGAPVYFDTQTNSWKPLDFGTQTMFYVYTDSYPESHNAGPGSTAPLKADVKQLNFAIDASGVLGNVIFTQFTVINRSTQVWNNAYITIWTDDDLGSATDDLVGCDTVLGLGYTYNATNNDLVYGSAPPAVAFLMLKGAIVFTGNNNDTVCICRNKTKVCLPRYKDLGMSVFNWFRNDPGPDGDPRNFRESYRIMSGFRKDGSPIVHPLGYITKYRFSGNPETGTGWIQTGPADQRFMMSTGPVNMNPGDTQVIVTAQIIAQGVNNLNSVTQLKTYSQEVRNYYKSCYTALVIGVGNETEIIREYKLEQNYPNPFNPVTEIRFSIPKDDFVSVKIFNSLGQQVMTLVNERKKAGTYSMKFDGNSFPSGVYFYTLETSEYNESRKMVLVK